VFFSKGRKRKNSFVFEGISIDCVNQKKREKTTTQQQSMFIKGKFCFDKQGKHYFFIKLFFMRKKRSPVGLEKATQRLAGLKSIGDDLVFGKDASLLLYEGTIAELRAKVNDYNTTLSGLDEKLALIKKLESELADLSERMLTGVAAQYGKDSDEYLKAGGTKKSERKQPKRKPSPPKS
jgi:hypothetical protein